jgi:hypothetical protein
MITIVRCYRTLIDANKRYLCWKPLYYKHLRLQTVANSPTEIQCVLARVTNLWGVAPETALDISMAITLVASA